MKNSILHRFYLHGYSGNALPVWFRRIAARSQIHRAWLSGFDGNFTESGIAHGTSNPYNGIALNRRAANAPRLT